MGVAEFHEARAFGIFDDGAFERNRAQLVGLSVARTHRFSSPARECSDRQVERSL
jgi:hypothetical protein